MKRGLETCIPLNANVAIYVQAVMMTLQMFETTKGCSLFGNLTQEPKECYFGPLLVTFLTC